MQAVRISPWLPPVRALVALSPLVGACSESPPPEPTPSSAPAGGESVRGDPWFEEVHADAGVRFRHVSGASAGRRLFPEIMGGGVALVDVENDGDLDLYLVQSGSLEEPPSAASANALYTNDGKGAFTDVSSGSGADDRGYGMGVAAGDVDQDGLTDLYVTNVGANALLRNLGAAHFDDVTEDAGVAHRTWSTSAAFLDFDADGDLDLYVCNYVDWSPERELECFTPAGRPDY